MLEATGRFQREIAARSRYSFGKNWSSFLESMNDQRLADAEHSLRTMLGVERLDGKTFLDIGSGSGLFSLAARRLGANVTSFDYDPDSVECTRGLKNRFFPDDSSWQILRGSVLDRTFLEGLARYDVVYSWGVLHHTGKLREAVLLTLDRVKPGGILFIALYRRTWLCPLWKVEKRLFVMSPPAGRHLLRLAYKATIDAAYRVTHPGQVPPRGMLESTDVDDWLGGYPYESVTPRALKSAVRGQGFALMKQVIKSEGVHITPGCDEYVFRRDD